MELIYELNGLEFARINESTTIMVGIVLKTYMVSFHNENLAHMCFNTGQAEEYIYGTLSPRLRDKVNRIRMQ